MLRNLQGWIGGVVLSLAAGASHAFPDKGIVIILPFSAGSTTDVNARDFAQVLSGVTRQSVVVDNRVGAEGIIAGQALIGAHPDAHTLLYTSSSLPVLDPLMKKNLPYDPTRDFAPVCSLARTSNVMNITAASPMRTVADVIAAAKAQPGKLTFAYTSATTRLAAELFQQTTGTTLTGVPYKSSVTALTEVGSGLVDLMFIDHISSLPMYQAGKVRALAVAGARRIKALPDVPSATEAGVPGYNIQPWFGLFAPGRTPPAVLAQAQDVVTQAMKTPEMIANLERRGLEPMPICGDALVKFQTEEIELWRGVLKKAGIAPQ